MPERKCETKWASFTENKDLISNLIVSTKIIALDQLHRNNYLKYFILRLLKRFIRFSLVYNLNRKTSNGN